LEAIIVRQVEELDLSLFKQAIQIRRQFLQVRPHLWSSLVRYGDYDYDGDNYYYNDILMV